jgi:hypothetical protein
MPARYRAAHHAWKTIAVLLVIGGFVSLFWVRWWIGIGAVILGLVMMPAVQRSAAEFVLEHAIGDASFYQRMVEAGVLLVTVKTSPRDNE